MPNQMYDVNVKVKISIPIIGDESISKINPPDDFEYRIVKFDEYEFKNNMIDGNGKITLDYIGAVHTHNEEDFILILYCEKEMICQSEYPVNSLGAILNNKLNPVFNSVKNKYEHNLLKYFSLLHLYKEGDIARKYSFYQFSASQGICSINLMNNNVCADMLTLNMNPMIISDEEIGSVNRCLVCEEAIYSMLKNSTLNGLEYTYHILDSTTNYINIVSILEVMFIKSKERRIKSENLSKRIAVFTENNENNIKNTYKKVKDIYDIRSSAIHNGKEIPQESLDELRELLRTCIKKYIVFFQKKLEHNPNMTFGEIRSKLITRLERIMRNTNFR